MNLPLYNGHGTVFTCVNLLTKYSRLIPCFECEGALCASSVSELFFDNVFRFFGIPTKVISDKDTRFTASFW